MSARRPEARLPRRARSAAAEAAFLRLLGLLFERPREGWAEQVRSLAADQGDERLRETATSALSATEGEYLGLFGPGGAVSPREAAHRGFADPGRILSDLSSLYERFAYRPRAEDPHDHVAVEVGFAGYLAMKEAYLLTARDKEGAARTREARALFLATHLRPLASGVGARLSGVTAPVWVQSAASILAGWAGCVEEKGTPRGTAGLYGALDPDTPLACHGCPEAAGDAPPDVSPAGER